MMLVDLMVSIKADPAKGAKGDAVAVVESGTLRSERRVPVPAVNNVNDDFIFDTRRLEIQFCLWNQSCTSTNYICMCVGSTHENCSSILLANLP